MKIFNAGQIKKWDEATMAGENIVQTTLMQRAGDACARWIKKKFDRSVEFYIICGKGGNGGDGIVIASNLLHAGYQVKIILSNPPMEFGKATLDHWNYLNREFPTTAEKAIMAFDETDILVLLKTPKPLVIIDALLGTGYNPGKSNEVINRLIKCLSDADKPTIAIDLPSGLTPDHLPSGEDDNLNIIQATYTLSFQAYKRSFLHPESAKYTGKVHLLDIGLSVSFTQQESSNIYAIDIKAAAQFYQPRSKHSFGHKGNFGTVVLVGGSYGKIGAISLSARAALRAGAGKVFIQAPKCGYEILQINAPEAMFEPAGDSYVSDIDVIRKGTYGIGPGMDTHPESVSALKAFLKARKEALVLDADALNIIATDPETFFPLVAANSVLTPHPGEFQRLFGNSKDSLEQVELAKRKAQQWHLIIVLKGHRTAICTPDGNIHYNLSGNAGMATAGSGDVLTGIITALMAQGYPPTQAAILGVHLHGLAGDCYINKGATESLIAQDLIDCLPKAFLKLKERRHIPFPA